MNREHADHMDHLSGAAHRARGRDVIEHHRGQDPAAVAQSELEILVALAPAAHVDGPQEENPRDPASFPKLSNLHDRGRR
jgi:hypothetical protein